MSDWKPDDVPTWFVVMTVAVNLAWAIPFWVWFTGWCDVHCR